MAKKYIESGERLYQLWTEYKAWCKENPYLKQEGKSTKAGVEIINLRQERPSTIVGFEAWLSENNIISDIGDYIANTGGAYSDYQESVARIRRENKGLLLSGALSHVWNPNLAGRYLGIAQIVENKITTDDKLDTKDLKPEHLEQLKNIIDEKFNK